MPALLIRHKVADYATWNPLFDAHGATRRANGSHAGRLYRNTADPNEIIALPVAAAATVAIVGSARSPNGVPEMPAVMEASRLVAAPAPTVALPIHTLIAVMTWNPAGEARLVKEATARPGLTAPLDEEPTWESAEWQ
jgi:hypothetical protein